MSTSKPMRPLRLLLVAAAGLAVVAVATVAVVFSSAFQTWVVRRELTARPELGLSVRSVSAGLSRVVIEDLHFKQAGIVVTVPLLEVEMPMLAVARGGRVAVTRLIGSGWAADLSRLTNPARPGAATSAGPAPGGERAAGGSAGTSPHNIPATAAQVFAGVFSGLALPREFALDGVALEGVVVLPAGQGQTNVRITGGGFEAGREGKLELVLAAGLADARVRRLEVRGTLFGRMDTPRSLGQCALKFAATGTGDQFPAGVSLTGEASAARTADGESYVARLSTQTHEILALAAAFRSGSARIEGTWKVNMRDVDVAPFVMGIKLPVFNATGEGGFDCPVTWEGIRASGSFAAIADRLEVLAPELAALGEIKLQSEFDVAARGGVLAVRQLALRLAGAQPVATVTALQPFEFDPASRAVRPTTDAAGDLVGVALHGLPLAWARSWFGEYDITGNGLQGELVGVARGGGIGVRTKQPLTVGGLSVRRGAERLVDRLEVAGGLSVDYNPQGWQAEIERLTLRSGGTTLAVLEGKAGQLKGAKESLKTTGKVSVDLASALAQPVAAGWMALGGGEAVVEFVASLGALKELQARVNLRNLMGTGAGKSVALPTVAADLRTDVDADGRIAFSAPCTLEHEARKSDLTISGTFAPGKSRGGSIQASLVGQRLVMEDLQAFAAVAPASAPAQSDGPRAVTPPWAGIEGTVTVQLGLVEYSDQFRLNGVSGRIELDAGKVKWEGFQAGLGDQGRAQLSGLLTYEAGQPQPFALSADVAVRAFDPGPLFPATGPGRKATVEGSFDLASSLVSRAASLGGLGERVGGEFHLSSKGGVFRGLPVSVSPVAENTGRVAGLIAAAGSALGGLTGKKEPAAVASRAQAVAEFSSGLGTITFDQLSVVLTRDAALNTTLRDFALIAPEFRLTGSGTVLHRPGSTLLEDSLAMEFRLRARGRQGELLKYLGLLEPMADDLGYAACPLPIRVGGTIGQPDASDLNSRLAALALEKSGVTEKAGELINRIIGGGK
jgi:hypothetical protein